MASRTFTDPHGVMWDAWAVIPGRHSQETEEPRRQVLPMDMAEGWLCFESAAGKRRLKPIPAGWDHGSEQDLWRYCQAAEPVRSGLRTARAAG